MLLRPGHFSQPIAAMSGGGGGAPSYDADATAYFAYSGALGDPRKQLISDLVAGIKSDWSLTNLSDGLLGFWPLANETDAASRKNIAKNDHHLTAVNSPTWLADRYWKGNGTTSYLATDFVPSTDGGSVLTANSAMIGMVNRTARTTGGGCQIGCAGSTALTIHCSWSNVAYMCGFGTENSNNGLGTSLGHWTYSRTGASLESNYHNSSSYEDPNSATGALTAFELFIDANNISGSPNQMIDDEIAFAYVGGGRSAAQVAQLHARIETYLDAIGAGVV